jgi:hypothetical protein
MTSDLMPAHLFTDFPEEEAHWQWLATAPEAEILRWIEEKRDSEEETSGYEEVTSE